MKIYFTFPYKIKIFYFFVMITFSTFAHAGFCEESEKVKFEKYADALHIDSSKFEGEHIYSSCKLMPNDTSKAILAFSQKNASSDASGADTYDLVIVIVDVSNAKILYKYMEKNAIQSDSLNYQMLSIDTANYMLNSKNRAFGIMTSHIAGNNYSEDALNLYLQKDNKILKIMSGLVVNSSRSDINQTCDGKYIDTTSTLSIGSLKNNGFYNLNIKTKKTIRIETPSQNKEALELSDCVRKVKITTNNNKLIFTGFSYLVPKELKAHMFN